MCFCDGERLRGRTKEIPRNDNKGVTRINHARGILMTARLAAEYE